MNKILFIVPPNIKYEDFVNPTDNVKMVKKGVNNYGAVITDIPLGVISLSAYLKKYFTLEAKLIDFNVVLNKIEIFGFCSFAEFFRSYFLMSKLLDNAPSVIGISSLFATSYYNTLDIAQCCREISPNSIVVAGGGVPTNMYRSIFKDSQCFDGLCYGEGEKPLLGLMQVANKLQYLEENPSWITRRKVENGQLFQHNFIENLDEIPFYDYGILDKDGYELNPIISTFTSINEKINGIPIMTSRGCLHHCCFCSSHTVHGRNMRYHSISRVRDDLTYLKNQYHVKVIIFQDDHFLANKHRAFEIINILRELHLIAFFQNSLALYALDRKMLEALKSIGVNQLVLSIESGSDRVLKEIIHKPLNLDVVKHVTDDCRELEIYMDANILIGFPGETKLDIEDTRSFLKTISVNWFRINVATPIVGSEMLDICLKKNYIKGDYVDCNYKKAIVETGDFTVEYMQEMSYVLNLELNFVENSDFRLGDYKTALQGFENAIKAKNDHAIAYYYAAKCYEKLGDLAKAQQYMDTAKMIATAKSFWRRYVDMFNIPI